MPGARPCHLLLGMCTATPRHRAGPSPSRQCASSTSQPDPPRGARVAGPPQHLPLVPPYPKRAPRRCPLRTRSAGPGGLCLPHCHTASQCLLPAFGLPAFLGVGLDWQESPPLCCGVHNPLETEQDAQVASPHLALGLQARWCLGAWLPPALCHHAMQCLDLAMLAEVARACGWMR